MIKQVNALRTKTLVVSSNDIQETIAHFGLDFIMDQLIMRLTNTIANINPEKTKIPARSGFNYLEPTVGLVEWMPIINHGEQVTIKVVGYHPYNPLVHDLPTILSTISSYDTTTGHLLGLIDGVLPTALRTGAASAVASKIMAQPDSKILGLIGCGAQSITQLHALSRLFDFEKVYIYDVSDASMDNFKDRSSMLQLNVEIIKSDIKEIIAESDIVCTATSIEVGEGPLFTNLPSKPHLHINAVGADFPGKVELPLDLLKSSFICPDFKSQAFVEGECQQLNQEDVSADLEEIVRNADKYHFVQNQRSVFDSTGWALEDQEVMNLFIEYALELGLGQYIKIETISNDSKNPYHFLKKEVGVVTENI